MNDNNKLERLKILKRYFGLDNITFDFSSCEDLLYHIQHYDYPKRDESFHKYLFFVIDWKIRKILLSDFPVSAIYLKKDTKTVLPVTDRFQILEKIKDQTHLNLPQMFFSTAAVALICLSVITIMSIYWFFMFNNKGFLLSIPLLINISFSLFVSLIPILITGKILPGFYKESYFIQLYNYEDFIEETVSLNLDDYLKNDKFILNRELAICINEFCESNLVWE